MHVPLQPPQILFLAVLVKVRLLLQCPLVGIRGRGYHDQRERASQAQIPDAMLSTRAGCGPRASHAPPGVFVAHIDGNEGPGSFESNNVSIAIIRVVVHMPCVVRWRGGYGTKCDAKV